MKIIELTQGYSTKVSDKDYEHLNKVKWYAHVNQDGSVYARRKINVNHISGIIEHMHRAIMNTPDNLVVDHKDGDPLNNQRGNLRNCTSGQNNANKGTHGKTGFKGVYIIAAITINSKNKHLGTFATPEEAAKAYDKAAVEHFGEFANLNY